MNAAPNLAPLFWAMDKVTHIPVVELNHLLTCHLCKGYIIDATTVVECLHSFCKTCIINYLDNHNTCPVCDTLLHKTRPQCAIRSDYAMQAIVYKLLPKVFDREMASRRKFYNCKLCHFILGSYCSDINPLRITVINFEQSFHYLFFVKVWKLGA